MRWLTRFVDSARRDSLAARLRARRHQFFLSQLRRLERPLLILDVGGLERFWEQLGFTDEAGVQVVLLNLTRFEPKRPNFESIAGDAREVMAFSDDQFDIVFSNSVIEHLGELKYQRVMASEIRRVGKRYFVQTPNRYFPLEPHFALPLFQFLPFSVRVWLIRHFDISWYKKIPERRKAEAFIRSFRLLSEGELRDLFPGGEIYREKLLGLTKSFVVYGGWNTD